MTASLTTTEDPASPAPRAWRADRAFAWWLLIAGVVGLLAAATLLIERIELLQDPTYVPSCSISPILSCGSVMTTDQASVFGFPNPIIGVAAFPIVATTGAVLLAGAQLGRWYWLGLQMGVTFGIGLVTWLAFQSLYRIGALCPYCMVVWAVVIPTFVVVTLRNLGSGVFGDRLARSRTTRTLLDWVAPLLLLPVLIVIMLITIRFWDYWVTLV